MICFITCVLSRRAQELEQQSDVMQQERLDLQQAAQASAERLQAVVQDKFEPPNAAFNAQTPIDQALSFLQSCIKVNARSFKSPH